MPEQLSKIRDEESPDPSKQKAKDEGFNWTPEEKKSCFAEYGCEILVDNGTPVEFGQVLMRVKPA